MEAEIKLADYGDALINESSRLCSNEKEVQEFVQAFNRLCELRCKKCDYLFNELLKSQLTGITATIEHKNDIFSLQYKMAKSVGIISSDDNVQCPECGSEYGIILKE